MKQRPVHVTWVDSARVGGGGWVDVDTDWPATEKALLHETVGYVVHQGKEALVIAHSRNCAADGVNHHSMVMGVLAIPVRAIIKVERA